MDNMIAMVQYIETEHNIKFEGAWDSIEDLDAFIAEHLDKLEEVLP